MINIANVHIGTNELHVKARKSLIIGILWCIPTLVYFYLFVAYQFHFAGFWHLTSIIPAGIGTQYLNKFNTYRSGIKGEKQTISIIERLPDGYEALTSIPIQYDNQKTELDMVVIGENGVFIIETKNHKGTIYGSFDDYEFSQHKIGQKGGEYTVPMKNPIKQVKRETWIISNYLKSKNINVWIQGIVFFSNPKTTIHILTDDVLVFDAKSGIGPLYDYITHYKPKRKLNQSQMDQIKSILMSLQN